MLKILLLLPLLGAGPLLLLPSRKVELLRHVASDDLPGSAGLIAELQVLIGAYGRWGSWLAVLSIGVLISAAYALRTSRRLSTGPERPRAHRDSCRPQAQRNAHRRRAEHSHCHYRFLPGTTARPAALVGRPPGAAFGG